MFSARAARREFPLAPPLNEVDAPFTYKVDPAVVPHHAAVFAPVRWTNVYAPCRHVIWGDVIGGPVRPLFGPGVKDVPLKGKVGRMILAHTHYWDAAAEEKDGTRDAKRRRAEQEHLDVLRAAINLLDKPEREAWSSVASSPHA